MLDLNLDQIFQIVGTVGTASFFFIAFSDMIVHSMDIMVQKFIAVKKSGAAKRLVYIWGALKEVYEEFRKFMDKMSAYSRPRPPGKE